MKNGKFKESVISAVTIFPSLIAFGIFLNIITSQKISWLFWMNIPAIIFEQILEVKFLKLSDNVILNLIFAFIFWLGVSLLINYVSKKFIEGDNGEISENS